MKKTKLYMDTVVEIEVVTTKSKEETETKINHAFTAFQKVEQACSRFSSESELVKACKQVGIDVPISPFLYEPIKVALEIADWTDGVFDPTIGKVLENYGFNQHYLTGNKMDSLSANSVTYKDIQLNEQKQTLFLKKPMIMDLGAIAKGFAIDLAANELKGFERFIVNAGGDIFAGGADPKQNTWKIGIQHPLEKDEIIQTVEITNTSICTSGSYERKSNIAENTHHIVIPSSKESPKEWISCSVIAPFAMMADVISTTVFLLGIEHGPTFIDELNVSGLFIKPDLELIKVGEFTCH